MNQQQQGHQQAAPHSRPVLINYCEGIMKLTQVHNRRALRHAANVLQHQRPIVTLPPSSANLTDSTTAIPAMSVEGGVTTSGTPSTSSPASPTLHDTPTGSLDRASLELASDAAAAAPREHGASAKPKPHPAPGK